MNSGARFESYVIAATAGSNEVSLNGGAARHVQPGDELILGTFTWLNETEAAAHTPKIVIMGKDNCSFEIKKS